MGASISGASEKVIAVNPDGTNIGGTGGASHTDDAAFTPASDDGTVLFAFADETSPDSVNEGDAGAVRMTLNRILRVVPSLHDGTTEGVDSMRGNNEGTLLASATRTANTSSANQTNRNAKGVVIYFRVTAAPGSQNLTPYIEPIEPVGSASMPLVNFGSGIITDVGTFTLICYPGAVETIANSTVWVQGLPLSRTWKFTVNHSSTGNWTYYAAFAYVL